MENKNFLVSNYKYDCYPTSYSKAKNFMFESMVNLFLSKEIKTYWWKGVPNFGDVLTPLLLNHFINAKSIWVPISEAKLISTGSILEHISPDWNGYILGSGRLLETSRLHLHADTSKIISLRGPLSARGISGNYSLGDPGILANELVGPQEKIYDLGILPHWKDIELVPKFLRLIKPPAICKVISPKDNPIEVLKQIGACKRIVTSSLHGMIVADSFGIPRRVEYCKQLDREGGNFKFRDYSASIKMNFETGKMMEASRFNIDDIKFNVYDAFKDLEGRLLNDEHSS